jgi:hypothetical protein
MVAEPLGWEKVVMDFEAVLRATIAEHAATAVHRHAAA